MLSDRWIAPIALVLLLAWIPESRADDARRCMRSTGEEARSCFEKVTARIEACRKKADADCEAELRSEGGRIDRLLEKIAEPVAAQCTQEASRSLGYFGVDDVVLRATESCADFADDALDASFGSEERPPLEADERRCQRRVVKALARVRRETYERFGRRCYLRQRVGRRCNADARDEAIAAVRADERRGIREVCGRAFDGLELSPLDPESSKLKERINELLDRTVTRTRHFAQRMYPPSELGPDARFGPYPVGVRTRRLLDDGRLDVEGTAPRPVRVEIYHPSTPEAVEGLSGDVANVLGFDIVETPAFRRVEMAPGPFPLVIFSHGNNGLRFQSFFFAAHLASHGYIVISPDHHGNNVSDLVDGVIDSEASVNRPLDMSFILDSFLALNAEEGNFYSGTIDEDAIGASGHSFGGYTTFALAGPGFDVGTFTDPRVKAILPQAPAVGSFPDGFFQAISIPTLVVGGSIDATTPFETQQRAPYEQLPSGAAVVGLANIVNGGHFTFSDYCEVPRQILGLLGGFEEACEPRHLPWRHAHAIINYLSLNFFDAILKDDAEALAKLDPEALAWIEDLEYESK